MSKIAIVAASGLGDGLLMMIAAYQLQKDGHDVVFFHDRAPLLRPLFPDIKIRPFDDGEEFDSIYLQNDNSARAWHFFEHREKYPELTVLFPKPSKMLRDGDIEFDMNRTFVENMGDIFGGRDNGLSFDLKRQRRVVIHPTSKDPRKCYPKEKFVRVAHEVTKMDYEVVFTVSPEEREQWVDVGFEVVSYPCLMDLAEFLAGSVALIGSDSAVGHLASNVGTPTVTISSNCKVAKMWRPGWSKGVVVCAPSWIPNFKGIGFHLREWIWHYLISVDAVIGSLKKIL